MERAVDGIEVARFGRAVGVKGEIKLHLLTDFPDSLKPGGSFFWEGGALTLHTFNPASSLACFDEIPHREAAEALTNKMLYTTLERTLSECPLGEDEYFWFQVIGCELFEEGECLGTVAGIERLGTTDYLVIKSEDMLAKSLRVKQFLVPYLEHFIIATDVKSRRIESKGARGIAEAS